EPTCNTPSNRACWSDGFDINTDYEVSTPDTGVTQSYVFNLTEVDNWMGPDGVVKEKVMLINGNIMGPNIVANWGDTVEVTVINNLVTNGTSIHWHGIHQKDTNLHDGANGVTECPIPPKGGQRTYRWRARQYGTSWYHSHFSAQYGNGVVGTIQINGPASLPYDIDLGVFPITDYYYRAADDLVHFTQNNAPPFSDNVLINGTAVNPNTGEGQYANVTLTPGKRHRLRILNTSTENHFQVSLVNHTMTVIAADMVPVNAMTVDSLFLAVGQRYDVVIDASRAPDNYWFNVTFGGQAACGGSLNPHPAAIFHYAGAPGGLPTDEGTPPVDHQCLDTLDVRPVVPRSVPVNSFVKRPDNTLPVALDLTGTPLFVWKVNGSDINVDWGKPIIDYILTGNTSYPVSDNIVQVDAVDQWTYWLIENDPEGPFSLPHPMHLHGHDFLVLGRSPDVPAASQQRFVFDPAVDLARLNGDNPPRRDTTMLPAGGWLLLAFRTDNPGAWLFHCHIAWHVSGGLSVDFLERPADLRQRISQEDEDDFNRVCDEWRAYWPTNPYPKIDSGL
nr:Chain A, LACCASE-1 [Melanocarpus albomyces]1GW0_B Chain B, LACCASE-1 [Melanocarpus albomyces]2IH8_A Chain A, Laccase-1 [Melanocarpus albomyces]2IH8_B Chain B, Laccase-1 [Melanocarpus albomyces]2IH9_A Chain A, Laccase-1 [Melanocarpus albomyces]2IH9_B Chain B, Laccase-1 [Melanocarpus albomyces]3FU7_B Chain B, Laccase-1 [Melanocarpus albomyces]3FU9_A Chain A, Laccase-1 [Melanocarpus albomyces]3FU9_B Chain B, Laccase-1 [Melanocarpus albomyces]3QPK_A Chain A, Laccase-1 [Melanocarpus albomyce